MYLQLPEKFIGLVIASRRSKLSATKTYVDEYVTTAWKLLLLFCIYMNNLLKHVLKNMYKWCKMIVQKHLLIYQDSSSISTKLKYEFGKKYVQGDTYLKSI